MFELEYEFREQDLVHFNELQLKNNVDIQASIRKNRVFVPAIMCLIGIFYYYYYGNILTTGYIGILAVAWSILSPYSMKVDMRRQFLEQYTETEKAGMFGIHTLKIEKDHLIELSPAGKKHKTPWAEMLRVEHLDKYVHIFVNIDSAIIIPIEKVKSGDLDKFARQAEEMIDRLG
ncbi:MAG: YcxB family protein [Methylococcales bacterium]|nr:YcxB family protein [Methylococcales bacterium]